MYNEGRITRDMMDNLKYFTKSILKSEKKERTKHLLSKENLEDSEDIMALFSWREYLMDEII